VFLIENGEYNGWECSECDVENLIDPLFIEDLTREGRVESEPELWHDEQDILVECVAH